jgi:hypothetical protein
VIFGTLTGLPKQQSKTSRPPALPYTLSFSEPFFSGSALFFPDSVSFLPVSTLSEPSVQTPHTFSIFHRTCVRFFF